jgi:hypothetical protein
VRKVLGKLREVLGKLRKLPGSMRKVPGSMRKVPGSQRAMSTNFLRGRLGKVSSRGQVNRQCRLSF